MKEQSNTSNKVEFPCIDCLTRIQCVERYTSNPAGYYLFMEDINQNCPMFNRWHSRTSYNQRLKVINQVFKDVQFLDYFGVKFKN